ncbi:MAG TPA: hypothetical protein PK647_11980, partial [Deltaproteobacteria bacterium]|nr:hypothetical protein [Deltaproteobacteria bacterium]
RKIISNRLQPFLPGNLLPDLIYSRSPVKRWDSSDAIYILARCIARNVSAVQGIVMFIHCIFLLHSI